MAVLSKDFVYFQFPRGLTETGGSGADRGPVFQFPRGLTTGVGNRAPRTPELGFQFPRGLTHQVCVDARYRRFNTFNSLED